MATSAKVKLINRGVAQLASALAWGARGRPFKSDHPDSRINRAFRNSENPIYFAWFKHGLNNFVS